MSARLMRLLSHGLLSAIVVAAAGHVAEARVVGRVVHVGYPAGRGHVVRRGAWTPVQVDLALDGQAAFDGYLRVWQPDKDGDLISDRVPVQLRSEAGAARRYTLYCLPCPQATGPVQVSVDLLDEDENLIEVIDEPRGEAVRSLRPMQDPEPLADREYLILSVTRRTTGKIEYLTTPDQYDKFAWRMVVAHLPPEEMPDRWQGLEGVDSIVWDGADATELTGPQLDALLTWVRHGGQLLVAAAESAVTLSASERLEPTLPVTIGKVISTRQLIRTRYQLLGVQRRAENEETDERDLAGEVYTRKLPVVLCTTADGAESLVVEPDIDEEQPDVSATVVAARELGRGRIVFVAAELSDLMSEKGLQPVRFFKRTLQLRKPRVVDDSGVASTNLFPYLDSTVGFRRSTGLFLLGALLFSVIYVGLATFGTWTFLRARGWTRHAWTAFALVAGSAAALSLLVVQGLRGMGQSVQQLTIVDTTAGEKSAMATAYFGLKTGTHTMLDVWMPSDYALETEPQPTIGYLKPLPSGEQVPGSTGTYTDPTRYAVVPGSALLVDVPIRATLKQFEGRWFGNLRRTLDADVRIVPIRDEDGASALGPSANSTITNNLGHDLHDCLLLQPSSGPFDRLLDQTPRGDDLPRSAILVHELGSIAAGQTITPADLIYYDARTGARLKIKEWSRRTLGEFQKNWGRNVQIGPQFGGGSEVIKDQPLERYQDAVLMLTALSEFNPTQLSTSWSAGHDFSRLHCRQLDLSDRLTGDYVLFIGFAADQGPVTLCTRRGGRDFRPLTADDALTVYRVRIPVQRLD